MGGSEMGDSEALDTYGQKQSAQRISAREKRPVNYTTMAAGTGEVSSSLDYDVGGSVNRSLQKKTGQMTVKEV